MTVTISAENLWNGKNHTPDDLDKEGLIIRRGNLKKAAAIVIYSKSESESNIRGIGSKVNDSKVLGKDVNMKAHIGHEAAKMVHVSRKVCFNFPIDIDQFLIINVPHLVIGTGNPRVIRDLPGPIPEKTHTLA